jgi:hypothetical protein
VRNEAKDDPSKDFRAVNGTGSGYEAYCKLYHYDDDDDDALLRRLT